jgi:hypothetical protein
VTPNNSAERHTAQVTRAVVMGLGILAAFWDDFGAQKYGNIDTYS